MSDRAIRRLFAAAVLGMVAYCATHLDFSTDVTSFLPSESDAELAALASRLADSELTRTMILTLGAEDPATAVAAAEDLARRLEGHPEVAWVRAGTDPDSFEHFYRIYFPHRHDLLSPDPEREIPALTTDAALRARAREVRRGLALPMGSLTGPVARADPLGGFERVLRRLAAQRPALALRDGRFLTEDGRWAVLFLATHASPFASGPQARLLADLEAAFAEIAGRRGGGLVLESSGANRFAVAAETGIRQDVILIAATTFLGVAALFLILLRSLHFLLLALLPPVAGMLTAATVTRAVLGSLDGLTLAFGATLIGVAIDYSIHVIDHHRLEPGSAARAVVARLRPSLVLGATTTMASFAGLGLTSFPGFREIGFFTIVGVAASLGVTLVVLPGFLAGATEEVASLPRRVARGLGDGVRALGARRSLLLVIPAGCVAVALAGLPGLRFDDDLSHLMAMDAALRAEEARVRTRVEREESGRVVFALGRDAEAALVRNERVAARLTRAREAGDVDDFRSVHALLWSRDLQERNRRALAAVPDLAGRAEAAFVAEGFRPGTLDPFGEALAAAPGPPLDAATLRASPLAGLLAPLLLDLGDRVAAVTYLQGVRSMDALSGALADLEQVHVFDQRTFVNEIYQEFRATTLRQTAVGSVLVVLVLALRYRRWRPTLAAFLPSVLVAGSLLGLFALLDVGVNLLHVTSLILVMGMGVDYGVFMVDSADDPRHLEATLLSLLLSCLTTVFVFGTLALSQHAALRAMGTTMGVGVLLSFVLAPTTLLLVRGPAR